MSNYFASKVEVRVVTNNISRIMKKIDALWQKYGFSNDEIVFWAQNRSQLHKMHDDIIRKYKVVRKVKY